MWLYLKSFYYYFFKYFIPLSLVLLMWAQWRNQALGGTREKQTHRDQAKLNYNKWLWRKLRLRGPGFWSVTVGEAAWFPQETNWWMEATRVEGLLYLAVRLSAASPSPRLTSGLSWQDCQRPVSTVNQRSLRMTLCHVSGLIRRQLVTRKTRIIMSIYLRGLPFPKSDLDHSSRISWFSHLNITCGFNSMSSGITVV